ncbi:hypothetical protein PINS_up007945 [Pythium insidiosum]|nr:hypothetical protein PINS_up007945 [Pythium insidiosum]
MPSPTLEAATRSTQEQSKHHLGVSPSHDNQAPTLPSPTLDRTAPPDDDTTSTSIQSDDEALSPLPVEDEVSEITATLRDVHRRISDDNGIANAHDVDDSTRTQEDSTSHPAVDVMVVGDSENVQHIRETSERTTVRQVRFAEHVTTFDPAHEEADDEDFPLDLLGADAEYDAMPTAVHRIQETASLEEAADEELLLVEQLIGEADALISQNPFDLPNRRNAANLPTGFINASTGGELPESEDRKRRSEQALEVTTTPTADREDGDRQLSGSSELDELDRLFDERKPKIDAVSIKTLPLQSIGTTINLTEENALEPLEAKNESRPERRIHTLASRKPHRSYERTGMVLVLLSLLLATVWHAEFLATPLLSLDPGHVVSNAPRWVKGLVKPAQAAQMVLRHEHHDRLHHLLSTKLGSDAYRTAINSQLGWALEQVQSGFTRVRSRLATQLESLVALFIANDGGFDDTSIKSVRDRFVALQYHQDRLRQRLQNAVQARELWALGVIERMRTRRLEFSKATNEVLRETRMVMRNVVQDVESSTRNHVQARLEQFKVSLRSSVQEEQKNHDAVQQEVDAAIDIFSEELMRATVDRDTRVKGAEVRLRLARTSIGIAVREVERAEHTVEAVDAQLSADAIETLEELAIERENTVDSMAREILTAAVDTEKAAEDKIARIRELEVQAEIEIRNVLKDEVIEILETQLKAGDEL